MVKDLRSFKNFVSLTGLKKHVLLRNEASVQV